MFRKTAGTIIIIFAIASVTFLIYEFWLKYEMMPVENIYEASNNNEEEHIEMDTIKLDPSIKIDKVIVYKEKRRMLLMRGGEVLKTYRVSLGKTPQVRKKKTVTKKLLRENIY